MVNEYDLAMLPGLYYDLDILPGMSPSEHATNNTRSADYQRTDLYRPTRLSDHVGGVDLDPFDADSSPAVHNTVTLGVPGGSAVSCREMSAAGGGKVVLADVGPGTPICVHTRERRWVLVSIRQLPASRTAPLLLHMTVLEAT